MLQGCGRDSADGGGAASQRSGRLAARPPDATGSVAASLPGTAADGALRHDGLVGLLMIEIAGLPTVEALEGGDAAERLRSTVEMRLWQAVPEDATAWPMGRTRFAVSLPGTDRRRLERMARRLRRRLESAADDGGDPAHVDLPGETPTRILIGGAIAGPAMAVTLGATASRALDQARGDGTGVVVRARRKPSGAAARGRPPRGRRVVLAAEDDHPPAAAGAPRADAAGDATTAAVTEGARDAGDGAPPQPGPAGAPDIPAIGLRPVCPRERPDTVAFDLVGRLRGGPAGMPLFDAAMRLLAHDPTRRLAIDRPGGGSGARLRDRLRVLAAMVPGLTDRLILVFPVDERSGEGLAGTVATLRRLGPAIALRPRAERALVRLSEPGGLLDSLRPDFVLMSAGVTAAPDAASPVIDRAKALDVAVVAELPAGLLGPDAAARLRADYVLDA